MLTSVGVETFWKVSNGQEGSIGVSLGALKRPDWKPIDGPRLGLVLVLGEGAAEMPRHFTWKSADILYAISGEVANLNQTVAELFDALESGSVLSSFLILCSIQLHFAADRKQLVTSYPVFVTVD